MHISGIFSDSLNLRTLLHFPGSLLASFSASVLLNHSTPPSITKERWAMELDCRMLRGYPNAKIPAYHNTNSSSLWPRQFDYRHLWCLHTSTGCGSLTWAGWCWKASSICFQGPDPHGTALLCRQTRSPCLCLGHWEMAPLSLRVAFHSPHWHQVLTTLLSASGSGHKPLCLHRWGEHLRPCDY